MAYTPIQQLELDFAALDRMNSSGLIPLQTVENIRQYLLARYTINGVVQPPASDLCGHKDCTMFRSCIQTWTHEDLERATRSASVTDMLKYSILSAEQVRRMQQAAPQPVSNALSEFGALEALTNGKPYELFARLRKFYGAHFGEPLDFVCPSQSPRRITPEQLAEFMKGEVVVSSDGKTPIVSYWMIAARLNAFIAGEEN